MNNTTTGERFIPLVHAEACIEQLRGSERGAAALVALSTLLWDNSTWSLDARNQSAMHELLELSLQHPGVRDLVQVRAKGAYQQLKFGSI